MIHVSDLSWTRKINHPSEILKQGEEIEAIVLTIDKTNQRISLGVKQLETDPWEDIDNSYKIGDRVTGKIAKIASFGAFVELGGDIDGLVHISQLADKHVERVKDIVKVGDEVEARVIKVDKLERRIGLSIKALDFDEEKLQQETQVFEALRPTSDIVGLEEAFGRAFDEYRPGESEERSPLDTSADTEETEDTEETSKK